MFLVDRLFLAVRFLLLFFFLLIAFFLFMLIIVIMMIMIRVMLGCGFNTVKNMSQMSSRDENKQVLETTPFQCLKHACDIPKGYTSTKAKNICPISHRFWETLEFRLGFMSHSAIRLFDTSLWIDDRNHSNMHKWYSNMSSTDQWNRIDTFMPFLNVELFDSSWNQNRYSIPWRLVFNWSAMFGISQGHMHAHAICLDWKITRSKSKAKDFWPPKPMKVFSPSPPLRKSWLLNWALIKHQGVDSWNVISWRDWRWWDGHDLKGNEQIQLG